MNSVLFTWYSNLSNEISFNMLLMFLTFDKYVSYSIPSPVSKSKFTLESLYNLLNNASICVFALFLTS